MATEKQIAFMKKLMAERVAVNAETGEIDPEGRTVAEVLHTLADREDAYWAKIEMLSNREVSEKIDRLMAAPRKLVPQTDVKVPEGHYAVASATGNNDLDFYRVDRPTEGKWAGRTFVKRIIGGHPEFPVRGAEATEALARIEAAGVDEARKLYGLEIGRCWKCNRSLTDETSRALGIGPECRKNVA